jgi:hypothetical protein
MRPKRHHKSPVRPMHAAALAASLLLAGCGGSSSNAPLSAEESPGVTTPRVAAAAVQRLKAPSGFHVGKCAYQSTGPYTLCYRRTPFVALDTTTFATLITASGLTPDSATLSCRRRPRSGADIIWDNCLGNARAGSVEFAVFASSFEVRGAIRPADRKVAQTLRGTQYELTLLTTAAAATS